MQCKGTRSSGIRGVVTFIRVTDIFVTTLNELEQELNEQELLCVGRDRDTSSAFVK